LEEIQLLAKQDLGEHHPWPCWSSSCAEHPCPGGCLSEWVDTDDSRHGNGMAEIVAPSWLMARRDSHECHGALADHGYSFVTFRLVRDTARRRN